ncbi:MAG: acylphosphatase [Acidobacteria bacterium]|nr:acylphosphatase [Acidobacteriota bacterium]
MITRRYRVRGIVQGVGFRYFVLYRARALGVCGWVRNLDDGCVEVLAQGGPDALCALEGLLREGPRHASVAGVTAETVDDGGETFHTFSIED